ncbi:hypothetical protein TELCIR_24501, partial [Teladorsagia circumcincta]
VGAIQLDLMAGQDDDDGVGVSARQRKSPNSPGNCEAAVAWSGISVRTLKRFPTERHMVEAKLMTEEEYDMYMNCDAPHGKWQ